MMKKFKSWWYYNVYGHQEDLEKLSNYLLKHGHTYDELIKLKELFPKIVEDVTKENRLIKIHLKNDKMA